MKSYGTVAEALDAVDSKNALWRVWEAISEQAGNYPYRPILFGLKVKDVTGKERMEIDEVEEDELIKYILEGIKEMAREAIKASNVIEDRRAGFDVIRSARMAEFKTLPVLVWKFAPDTLSRTRSR